MKAVSIFVLSLVFTVVAEAGTARLSGGELKWEATSASTRLGKFLWSNQYSKKSLADLEGVVGNYLQIRKAALSQIEAEVAVEKKSLREEHKNLMINRGMQGFDGEDGDSNWALKLSNNIAAQALLGSRKVTKVASWENQNYLEVAFVEVGQDKYVTSLALKTSSQPKSLASN